MSFTGFSNSAIDFFNKLAENNNRDWFHEHKEEYETLVKAPARELVEALAPMFHSDNIPYICNPKKAVFRINRDIRFSNNKDPYKTNLGLYFPYSPYMTNEKTEASVGLYFHLDPAERFIGGGMYAPPSPLLKCARKYILEHYEDLEEILEAPLLKEVFPGGLYGESLKKTPLGFPKEHPADKYLKLKSYLVGKELDFNDVSNAGFIDIMHIAGKAIAPLMDFIYKAKEGAVIMDNG